MNKYIIQGIAVAFLDAEPHSEEEARAYLQHARSQGGDLKSLLIKREGEYADLSYTFNAKPFERIRRITGYLTGTTDRWNSAKHAELEDRVAHSTTPGPGETPQEEAPEAAERPAIRANDFVLHRPTDEEWVVCGVNDKHLIPCGYPFPTRADLADCELLESRSLPQPEEYKNALRQHGLESFIERDPNDQTEEKER